MSNFDQSIFTLKFFVSGGLSVANGVEFTPIPVNADLVRIDAYAGTAPTGTNVLTVRVNKNGTGIQTFSFVAAAQKAVVTLAYPVTSGTTGIDDSQPNLTAPSGNTGFNYILPEFPGLVTLGSFIPGDNVSVDVTVVGGTIAGSNLSALLTFVKK
jgi:hypothetical protein